MTYRVVYAPRALRQLSEIEDYIAGEASAQTAENLFPASPHFATLSLHFHSEAFCAKILAVMFVLSVIAVALPLSPGWMAQPS